MELDGEFKIKGSDLVALLKRSEEQRAKYYESGLKFGWLSEDEILKI